MVKDYMVERLSVKFGTYICT